MSKRTVFTTVTPLPAGITRETVIETLHSHTEMIDLNPLVIDRFPVKPPRNANAEEYHCIWYQLTDKVQYLPGGLVSGKVSYNACFHDLASGLQTHVYAPMGLDIKGKWSLGGSLPGEPKEPYELGLNVPREGLYLREDVDMRCNFIMTGFVTKTLKKAHSTLVDRLIEKSHIKERHNTNDKLAAASLHSTPLSSPLAGSFSHSTPVLSHPQPHRSPSPYAVSPFHSPALDGRPGSFAGSVVSSIDSTRYSAHQLSNPYPQDQKRDSYKAYQPQPQIHEPHPATIPAELPGAYTMAPPPPGKEPAGTNPHIPNHPVELEG